MENICLSEKSDAQSDLYKLSVSFEAFASPLPLFSNLNFYDLLGETYCHIKDLKLNVSFLSVSILEGIFTCLFQALWKSWT